MIDTDKIRFAGDISVKNISVVTSKGMTQNITNQTISIEMFEDLFSPFTTGIITVKDSYDFVNLFPFVGEEFINIDLFTPGFENEGRIKQQYYIFKITDRTLVSDRTVVYQLHFISREAIADANKHVSKSYSGKISDIARDLIKNKDDGLESTKDLIIEKTQNSTKFISNYWTPVKSLYYISGAALNPDGACSYLFFENRKGLNFVSLEYLYSQEPVMEFVQDNYTRDVESDGRSTINLNQDYMRILNLDIPILQDYLERARSGMFASKIITADILTIKYHSSNFDMLNNYEKTVHLNPFAPTSNSSIKHPNSLVINYKKYYGVFNGYGDVSNSKHIQRRISQIFQAQNNKINITVLGRTDYTVGMKVKLKLYKIEPIAKVEREEDTIDKILSGYYIISAINHSITKNKHECTMELIKDSYIKDLNEVSNQ